MIKSVIDKSTVKKSREIHECVFLKMCCSNKFGKKSTKKDYSQSLKTMIY